MLLQDAQVQRPLLQANVSMFRCQAMPPSPEPSARGLSEGLDYSINEQQ